MFSFSRVFRSKFSSVIPTFHEEHLKVLVPKPTNFECSRIRGYLDRIDFGSLQGYMIAFETEKRVTQRVLSSI